MLSSPATQLRSEEFQDRFPEAGHAGTGDLRLCITSSPIEKGRCVHTYIYIYTYLIIYSIGIYGGFHKWGLDGL